MSVIPSAPSGAPRSPEPTEASGPTEAPEPTEASEPSGPADGSAAVEPAGPVLRSPVGMATALSVLLVLATVVALPQLLADYRLYASLTAFIDDGPTSATMSGYAAAARFASIASSLALFAQLPTAVLFLVWFHQVRVNAGVFAPEGFGRGTRWAVGCWFIPIGHLWLPFKTATEIWGASAQAAPDGSWRRVSYGPVVAWWATWAGSHLLQVVANRLGASDSATVLRTSMTVSFAADLLFLASGVLAVRFVRGLTAMQYAKATQGPNALV
ncbi:DUF4328 domain-containing protein [Streptomyces sp. PvR034]|uniref:DUF4328 domain-containing protein n=1 Tax=Streptomyces sp. PvR034 TaxID=3156401 RepID=UPI0033964D82